MGGSKYGPAAKVVRPPMRIQKVIFLLTVMKSWAILDEKMSKIGIF
jgi:hypothetical protein